MPTDTLQDVTQSLPKASGMMIFNSMGRAILMNREARLFLWQFNAAPTTASHSIPEEIHSIVRDLIRHLMDCEHPKDCESIQIERLYFGGNQPVLLRGFCVPDTPVARNSYVLIVIEELKPKSVTRDTDVQEIYKFTEREKMVITYLMLGFTNKEIANRLNLSEYTVKEHLKRIMHKTKSTTRTALMARIIFPAVQEPSSSTHIP